MEAIIDPGTTHAESAAALVARIDRLHERGAVRVEVPPRGPLIVEYGEVDFAAELGGVPW